MKITGKKLYHAISAMEFNDALDWRTDKQKKEGRNYRKKMVRLLNKKIRKMKF